MELLKQFERLKHDASFEYLKWRLYLHSPSVILRDAKRLSMYAYIDDNEVRYYVVKALHMNNKVGMLMAKKQILQISHYNNMSVAFKMKPSNVAGITFTKKLDMWKYK